MPNTVQLTQNGQPVYPVTDVSLITGLEERSGMRVIPYTTRPTASAETAGFIYMDESTLDLYVTKATSGSYSWVSAGNLSNIDLDNCVTKTEFEQLGQEVHNLSGKYYGVFTSSSSLPEGDAAGHAFVGTAAPFAIYNFDGTNWADSGATVDGVSGEPGVGFESVSSQQDGTLAITLTNGDTVTIDLNHNHSQYPKYYLCEDEAEYTAIVTKDEGTLYLIPETSA